MAGPKGIPVKGHDKKPFTKANAREMQAKGAIAKRKKNEIINLCTDMARKILASEMPVTEGAKKMFETFGIKPTEKESVILVGMLRCWQKVYLDRDIAGLEKFVKLAGIHPDQPKETDADDKEIRVIIEDA